MKNAHRALLLAAVLLPAASAQAQTYGQFTAAPPIDVNGRMFGVYLQSSENVLGLLGQLRLSFYPGVDFSFHGGIARQDYDSDSRTALRLGTDIKYAMVGATTDPYSLAVGGALGIEMGDDYSVLVLGPKLIGSARLAPGETVALTPFAAVGIHFTRINAGDLDDTDFSVPLFAGAVLRLNQQVDLVGEFDVRLGDDVNDDIGFSLGANFPF